MRQDELEPIPGDLLVATRDPGGVPQTGRRARAARGTVINSVFLITLNVLAMIKGFVVAGFVSVFDYGIWGLLIVSFTTLYGLIQVGVNDKYIQQDSPDQQAAFQTAFTLQLMLSGAFVVLIFALMPLYAIAFGTWELLLPGWALAAAMPASAFQAPLWTFYRRMDFFRQRQLQLADPLVGIPLTIGLAAAGMGYWAFVVGTVCGAWAAAAAAVRASPYRLGLRFERGTARSYWTFSGPLMFQSACIALLSFGPTLVAQRALGTVAVGAIAIAGNITRYTYKVNEVVSDTLYPVVCAVKDRRDLLEEAFLKSNRLSLLWATPAGLAMFLFAPDLVHFGIGSRWSIAIPVIQALGLVAVIYQIGFNWSAFFRALGDTRPLAVGGFVMAVGGVAIVIPLLLVSGLDGYAVGMGVSTIVLVIVRLVYLRRLFPLGPIVVNVARGMLPGLVAACAAGALRLARWGGERTELDALSEIATLFGLALALTLVAERRLLAEFRAYLRAPGSWRSAPDDGEPGPTPAAG